MMQLRWRGSTALLLINLCTVLRGGDCRRSSGTAYTPQLMRMYPEMMQVYGLYGRRILQEVQQYGPARIKHAHIKSLHVFKRETLHLLEIYVDKAAQDGPNGRKEMVKSMVGQILEPILTDYRYGIPLDPGLIQAHFRRGKREPGRVKTRQFLGFASAFRNTRCNAETMLGKRRIVKS